MREISPVFEITAELPDTLQKALDMIYDKGPTHWIEVNGELHLYEWGEPKEASKFLGRMYPAKLFPVVKDWLADAKVKETKYEGEGSTVKGFNISTIPSHGGSLIIKPVWIFYGK